MTGQVFSHYRIIEKLGEGGMGVVYKAVDEKLERHVALKFLSAKTPSGPARTRFLHEARAASALDHPNIGVVHGIQETSEGELYIVMAYYDGESLAQRLKRGACDVVEVVEIGLQIAEALAEAHSRGIVHSDLKPGNVMLTRQGLVKLLDFGLARLPDAELLTQPGQVHGTPAYMSPEQANGERGDHRSDLWALGVVLFEMLTGQRPFVRDNAPSTLLAVVRDSPPALNGPEALKTIVYRCLAKDPDKRYQRARHVVNELSPLRLSNGGLAPTLAAATGESAAAKVSADGQEQDGKKPAPGWSLARRLAFAAALTLTMVGGVLVWRREPPAPSEKHVVVLPFTNVGEDSSGGAIRDGILETLTSRLTNLERLQATLWVAPASEVRRKGVVDATSAQRVFGANLVVTGSVQRDKQGVRLTLNLIDAKTLRQLGSAVIDDPSADFPKLQDKAVAQLAKLLEVGIRPGTLRQAEGETATASAYESYLQGLSFLQRYDKPQNLDSAIQHLKAAVKSDPHFALAYTRLAEAEFLKSQSSGDAGLLEQALADGQRAAAINNKFAPVHVTLGRIHAGSGKNDLAAEEFLRALDADPRSPEAHQWIARTYESQGRLDEAEASLKKAVALRPSYWEGYNNLGAFLYRRRKFSEAAEQFRRVIQLTPDNATAYINLGVMLNNLKDPAGAAQAYEKSLSLAPNYAAYSNLAVLYYTQRDFARAVENYEKAIKMNDRDYRPWGGLAEAHRAAGSHAKARPAFEHAVERGEEALVKNPSDFTLISYVASYYAKLGNAGKARDRIVTALTLAPKDQRVAYRAALIYEMLGNRSMAVKYLREALRLGYSLESIRTDPDAARLLEDPALRELMR